MANHIRIFCKRGHDKRSVGVYKNKNCKQCHKVRHEELRLENPEKYLKQKRNIGWRLRKIRNLDGTFFQWDDYVKILKNQNFKCKICGIRQENLTKILCADHNHVNGLIRGLLCMKCNTKVGVVENYKFEKVLAYLKEYNK